MLFSIGDCCAVIHNHKIVLIAGLRVYNQPAFARLLALQVLLCRKLVVTALMLMMVALRRIQLLLSLGLSEHAWCLTDLHQCLVVAGAISHQKLGRFRSREGTLREGLLLQFLRHSLGLALVTAWLSKGFMVSCSGRPDCLVVAIHLLNAARLPKQRLGSISAFKLRIFRQFIV